MEQTAYHHGSLRASLVSCGTEMLNQKGVAGVSLRELARNIGVGHNAPYRHFSNKQQLLEAIAEEGFRRLKARHTRLALELADDPEGQIFESAMHVIGMAAEQPEVFQLMFGGHIKPQSCGDGLKGAADEAVQSLVSIIRCGQQQKVFIKGDAVALSMSTMSMIQGIAMMVASGKLTSKRGSVTQRAQPCGVSSTALRTMVFQLFDVFLQGLKLKRA